MSSAIRDHVGSEGTVDQGRYHPHALLPVHGSGYTIGLEGNLTAWTLASAWRRMPLYPFYGSVVVTGRTQDGDTSALNEELAGQAYAVAQTVRATWGAGQTRPPASNEAAVSELLADTARDVTARR
ncbi:hypothetical protein [Streptomyces sp. SAI-208]|uniref:hypothetical protein n=1 Tax=Streptomyces sp. SAI-208 TaxID=2940550 RepID=UPI0024746CB4|nr:hypothetical protein [Streptomyces sp. SAI-208]